MAKMKDHLGLKRVKMTDSSGRIHFIHPDSVKKYQARGFKVVR